MIFDEIERTDARPKQNAERDFTFYNRCARPFAETVRKFLDAGVAAFPEESQAELIARLRNGNDTEYAAATFEIGLHAILQRRGHRLEVHPEAPNGKRPDFRVHTPAGEVFYLEAVLTTERGWTTAAAEKRKGLVYDALGSGGHANFYVTIESTGDPTTQPPGRSLRRDLVRWLDSLDPNDVQRQLDRAGTDSLPKWQWEHEDWNVEFNAFPVAPELRGRSTTLIGARGVGAGFVDSTTPIRDAVRDKGRRYGRLDAPLVIAVSHDALHHNWIDVDQALYGTEEYRVRFGGEVEHGRASDGAWLDRNGPHLRSCSALWAFGNMASHNLARVQNRLYVHPGPLHQVPDDLLVFPRVVYDADARVLQFAEGVSIREAFAFD